MSTDEEVKSLIESAARRYIETRAEYCGARPPHGDYAEEFYGNIAAEVYEAIWEYIKDYD